MLAPVAKFIVLRPQGAIALRYKMLEQPQESWVKSRSRFLIKFFFFSDLEPQSRRKLLEARLAVCYQRQAYLNQEEAVYRPTDPYQAAIWHRAKAMLQSEIEWLCQFLPCTSEVSHLMLGKDE